MTTFYDLLNISYNDNINDIKYAYKNKIKIYKFKKLEENDILKIKQLKTAYFILTNDELKDIYDNFIFNDNNIDAQNSNNNIDAENSINETNLDILFTKIIDNNTDINIPNTKNKSLDNANKYMNERIFTNITPLNNKIVYNSLMPIQTREDRKLNN
jgi:DnaJ-class molecular chaperone